VGFDRNVTLRNAEKLIRQGKLDLAVAEYLRVIEDQPGDWNVANALGDLYVRAGKIDKAIEQFLQIADGLNDEGAAAKAGAIYKKILKLKPDHEHTLANLSEILAGQKLYADARAHLNALVDLRRSRGDARGVLHARIRLGVLDPEDYEARLAGVKARVEMGDKGGALNELKDIASELTDRGRQAEAIEVLRDAAKVTPDDDEIRGRLLEVYLTAGEFARARECATTVEQFRRIATALEGQDKPHEALATLQQASAADPSDMGLNVELARAFVAKGDLTTAAQYLTVEAAGDDPVLLLAVADIKLRGTNCHEGLAIARWLLETHASRRDEIAMLGWTIAEQRPDVGFQLVELAADHAVSHSDFPAAAAALQEFVTRVPNHVAALMRLVEVCVDGGLEATMYSAQAQLADAYIAAGAANEARYIAEDLVAREPWEKSNLERFRRALVLLGEPDPDALIADRLSGKSPFTATDLFSAAQPPADELHAEPPAEIEQEADMELEAGVEAAVDAGPAATRAGMGEPVNEPAWKRPQHEDHHFELGVNAIDLDSILGDFLAPPPPAKVHAASDDVEVDLSIVLDDIKPPPAPKSVPIESGDLDGVFGQLRDENSRRPGSDESENEYQRAQALRSAGDIDGCIQALESASRAPRLRFATASLLGQLFRERGDTTQSIDWFERAAQAPAPTPEAGYQILYELADGLDQAGETARALAILLELHADAGAYRDIDARIDRLTKVQTRG
jgi:tetratricopeptide (TPR) repeat protein